MEKIHWEKACIDMNAFYIPWKSSVGKIMENRKSVPFTRLLNTPNSQRNKLS
jgi:hypothetical protein